MKLPQKKDYRDYTISQGLNICFLDKFTFMPLSRVKNRCTAKNMDKFLKTY